MKKPKKKGSRHTGKRAKVLKLYNPDTWESDSAKALARAKANKPKWGE